MTTPVTPKYDLEERKPITPTTAEALRIVEQQTIITDVTVLGSAVIVTPVYPTFQEKERMRRLATGVNKV